MMRSADRLLTARIGMRLKVLAGRVQDVNQSTDRWPRDSNRKTLEVAFEVRLQKMYEAGFREPRGTSKRTVGGHKLQVRLKETWAVPLTAINASRVRSARYGTCRFLWRGRSGIMARDNSNTWGLAINSARCRIVRGLSDRDDGVPAELVLRSEARSLRDIMADKPGRSFASKGGGRRSAMEYASDPVAEDQREFVRQVIALLESHRLAGEFDKLAIFAEHDILGHLRQLMPKSYRDIVICEVPKNLLHLSEQELPKAILRELADGARLS